MIEAFVQSIIAFVWRPAARRCVQIWTELSAFLDKFNKALVNPECNVPWQVGHVLGGALFVLLGASVGGIYAAAHAGSGHQVLACVLLWAALTTVAGDLVYVPVKEFVYDPWKEKASISGGLDDALHYWSGSAFAWVIVLVIVWYLGVN